MTLDPIARIDIQPGAARSEAAQQLLEAVWPPEVVAKLPWRTVVWARPERRVLAYDDAGVLIGHAELFQRDARWEGRPVKIGGVGAVATREDRRRQGVASRVMRRAVEEIARAYQPHFALLFCEPRHAPIYQALGWCAFGGDVYVDQPQGHVRFEVSAPYVFDMKIAPRGGVLDLCGLPW